MYDEDIKKTKDLERKKWLQELEEQKREKQMESQRVISHNYPSNYQTNESSAYSSGLDTGEERSFGRTRILLDPAQIEDMERKRKQNLIHKQEIEAQIQEKRRLKQLEEEIQEMDNLRVENEAREQKSTNEYSNE
jgi:hypothetical protein